MQAFTKHLIPRLGIRREKSNPRQVRITLLSRSTKQRRIVNEEEVRHCIMLHTVSYMHPLLACVCVCVLLQLVNAMKTVGYFDVRVVDYKYR